MRFGKTCTILSFMLMLAVVGTTALANDKITSDVSIPAGQPVPNVIDNGKAVGTIQLFYTVTGFAFPCEQFAQFNLSLQKQGTETNSAYLKLQAIGQGTAAQLQASPDYFDVGGPAWSGESLVTININCSDIPSNPPDGYEIVGNLKETATVSASDNRSAHIDTITNIQVHIKLAHPTSCLKLYSFETEQVEGGTQVTDVLNSLNVVIANGKISSINPGQVSVDAMVVNICNQPETFDLSVGLDPLFLTNPSGNPGQATFTYTTAGEYEPTTTFNLSAFGQGTNQGQTLCLGNITLGGGESFLATVHTGLNKIFKGESVQSLPSDGAFDFSATLFKGGTGCSEPSAVLLDAGMVTPSNPALSYLTFTLPITGTSPRQK